MQRSAARVVRISKYGVRISPRILTTDPRPRRQADAVSDPLSVASRGFATRFLTHSTHPQPVVKVDRRIRWHYTTTVLRLRIGARLTRYRNCKLHNFARTISRHADGISRYSLPPSAGPLLPLPSAAAPRVQSIWALGDTASYLLTY